MQTGRDPRAHRRWSTDDVEQRHALAYWVDTVCERFLALEIDTPPGGQFHARLDQADLGPATLNLIQAERQCVRRTPAGVARSHDPVSVLMQLRAGRARLRQLGREACLLPGESVFIDGTQPYELECPERTSALALRMPEPWLKRWVPAVERLPARVFGGGGWNAALNAAMASVDVVGLDGLALPPGAVAEQIAALLALAVGSEGAAPARDGLYPRLLATLRDRLHEADLAPLAVAAGHGISLRRLHYAFAGAGTTFSEQLMRLRLEHAVAILEDVRVASLPITEVAARCGFADPSHFARRFRARYAQAPQAYRLACARRRH